MQDIRLHEIKSQFGYGTLENGRNEKFKTNCLIVVVVVVVVVVYFILSRLLYLAFSANFGLLCMPHPGMGPLV